MKFESKSIKFGRTNLEEKHILIAVATLIGIIAINGTNIQKLHIKLACKLDIVPRSKHSSYHIYNNYPD